MTEVAAGQTYYYTQDGLGSVRTVTDAAGAVKNKYDTAAFGEAFAANTTETVKQRFGFTGRENNPVSGTMNYRYRTYMPGLGIFGSRDPLGYEGGIGLHSYVGNSPAVLKDAFGLYGHVAHETMVKYIMEQMGVPRRVAEEIAKQNAASDSPTTFLANPEAHALSYGIHLAPMSEYIRRLRTFQRWQKFTRETRNKIINKLSKDCCDCSVFEDMGRLSHAIQDAYYHGFNTWIGWHWYTFFPSNSVPVREESDLDRYLTDDGNAKLKELMDSPATRNDPNAATRSISSATEATQALFSGLRKDIGGECWDTLMKNCENKFRDEELAKRQAAQQRRDLERQAIEAHPEAGPSVHGMSSNQLRQLAGNGM